MKICRLGSGLEVYAVFAVGFLFLVELKGSQSAPIKNSGGSVDNSAALKDVIVIFISSCVSGKRDFHLAAQQSGRCVNVNSEASNIDDKIKTDPAGIILRLFEKPDCDESGNSALHDPSSTENTSQKTLPFKVSSFMIEKKS